MGVGQFDGTCGFRCGLLAYQKAFPAAFVRRDSPGGIILPFTSITTIDTPSNFGSVHPSPSLFEKHLT